MKKYWKSFACKAWQTETDRHRTEWSVYPWSVTNKEVFSKGSKPRRTWTHRQMIPKCQYTLLMSPDTKHNCYKITPLPLVGFTGQLPRLAISVAWHISSVVLNLLLIDSLMDCEIPSLAVLCRQGSLWTHPPVRVSRVASTAYHQLDEEEFP